MEHEPPKFVKSAKVTISEICNISKRVAYRAGLREL